MTDNKWQQTDGKIEDSQIRVTHGDDGQIDFRYKGEELIKIKAGHFFWKGKEVKDVHNVYNRFNDWLSRALSIGKDK